MYNKVYRERIDAIMTEKNSRQKTDFDSSKITGKELQKYEQQYSEDGFLNKIAHYGKNIGLEALLKAVQLWYVMQRSDVPASTKAVIMGALGYLIAPLDFLPDFTPLLGYSDDLVAITFALIKVQGYIDDDVKAKSLNLLKKVFGKEAIKDLT